MLSRRTAIARVSDSWAFLYYCDSTVNLCVVELSKAFDNFGKVLSTATVDVILHLINSKCLPVLLYGLEVCPLTKADMHSLDFCVNRFLMKLLCTNNISIVDVCRYFFNFELPRELLRKRTAKFLHKLHAHTVVNLFSFIAV